MIIASYCYSITVTEPFSLSMFVLSVATSTLPEWSYIQGDQELANCPVGQIGLPPVFSKVKKVFTRTQPYSFVYALSRLFLQ